MLASTLAGSSVPESSAAAARRYLYLDIARIGAILGVIAIHNWSLLNLLVPGSASWWADDVLFHVGRWAVPVFVMMSGGLLLQTNRIEQPLDFYRRRLWRVGLPGIFWIAAYFMFRGTVLNQELTRRSIFTDLANATPFTHLYFVYVIVGLYLATPLIRPFVTAAGRRAVAIAASLFLGVIGLDATLPYLIGAGTRVTGLTYWLPFVGYYLAGAALFGLHLSRARVLLVAGAAVAAVAVQILANYWLTVGADGTWANYARNYWSPFTIVAALAIFTLAARETAGQHRSGRWAVVVRRLGEATFGVYLIHEMLLYLHALNFVHGSAEQLVVARIPTYFSAIVGSFTIVLVARRIPIVRSVF